MKTKRLQTEGIALTAKKALKKAVHKLMIEHKQTGDPIAVLEKGKVIWIPASKIRV